MTKPRQEVEAYYRDWCDDYLRAHPDLLIPKAIAGELRRLGVTAPFHEQKSVPTMEFDERRCDKWWND